MNKINIDNQNSNLVIRKILPKDIDLLINLRFESEFLKNNSIFSLLGKDFTKKIFLKIINSKSSISKIHISKDINFIHSYFIVSTDLLKTIIDLLPIIIFHFFIQFPSKKGNNFSFSFIKYFFQLIYISLNYIFLKSWKYRSSVIEIYQNKDSTNYYSSLILSHNIFKELAKKQIFNIKTSFYSNNIQMKQYLKKIASIYNFKLYELKSINLNEKIISIILLNFKQIKNIK